MFFEGHSIVRLTGGNIADNDSAARFFWMAKEKPGFYG